MLLTQLYDVLIGDSFSEGEPLFQIDWNNYQNSFILTDGDDYRVVELVFFKKISWT